MKGCWRAELVHLVLVVLFSLAESKELRQHETCPDVCEPEKCPNVGPIVVSECPSEQHIVTDRCGCCKRCDIQFITSTLSPDMQAEVCGKMTCPKKKICVLNQQGLPVCKCPTEDACKKLIGRGAGKKSKICGSDGVTYPSRCHLKVASCASDGKIRVAKRGDCSAEPSKHLLTTGHQQDLTGKSHGGKSRSSNKKNSADEGRGSSRGGGRGKKQSRKESKKHQKKLNKKRERNYHRGSKINGGGL